MPSVLAREFRPRISPNVKNKSLASNRKEVALKTRRGNVEVTQSMAGVQKKKGNHASMLHRSYRPSSPFEHPRMIRDPYHPNCDCRQDCEREHCEQECCKKHRNGSNMDSFSPTVDQFAAQLDETNQGIYECLVIKDSVNVNVSRTATQASLNVQAALQLALTLVLSMSIDSSETADKVSEELLEATYVHQNRISTINVENSANINVISTSTDISANVQLLLQVLLALVAKLDIA
jgi:spore coat protein X